MFFCFCSSVAGEVSETVFVTGEFFGFFFFVTGGGCCWICGGGFGLGFGGVGGEVVVAFAAVVIQTCSHTCSHLEPASVCILLCVPGRICFPLTEPCLHIAP